MEAPKNIPLPFSRYMQDSGHIVVIVSSKYTDHEQNFT